VYLRIKRRELKRAEDKPRLFSFRIYVVENNRVDGKPRQRIVSYLGSIRSDDLRNNRTCQEFLRLMHERIDRIPENARTLSHLKMKLIHLVTTAPRQIRSVP